eukprot:TRINITY_DN51379_c0_g1_i1.p1 TRINITY_DN51379_c0_g1~~TRINITY_DN51379_c0_g1_i1.p1  ORF type:complete len:830 (-),score=131.93 TRINITY_DN51379_c0_g1_i1:61-2550(-)
MLVLTGDDDRESLRLPPLLERRVRCFDYFPTATSSTKVHAIGSTGCAPNVRRRLAPARTSSLVGKVSAIRERSSHSASFLLLSASTKECDTAVGSTAATPQLASRVVAAASVAAAAATSVAETAVAAAGFCSAHRDGVAIAGSGDHSSLASSFLQTLETNGTDNSKQPAHTTAATTVKENLNSAKNTVTEKVQTDVTGVRDQTVHSVDDFFHQLQSDFEHVAHGESPEEGMVGLWFRIVFLLLPAAVAGMYFTRPQHKASEAVGASAQLGGQSAMSGDRGHSDEAPLSQQDEEAIAHALSAEDQSAGLIAAAYTRFEPAARHALHLQGKVEARVENLKTKSRALIEEELQAGLDEVKEHMSEQLPPVDIFRIARLPSAPMLLAGLCAPVQLRGLDFENKARLCWALIVLGLDMVALGVSWGVHCPTLLFGTEADFLPDWMTVDATMLMFEAGIRLNAYIECSRSLAEVDSMYEVSEQRHRGATASSRLSDVDAIFHGALQRHLVSGATALLSYDRLKASSSFGVLPWLSAFDLFWQLFGWVGLFDTPFRTCDCHFLLRWARFRGVMALLLFAPMAVNVVVQAVKFCVERRSFALAVLRMAQAADQNVFGPEPTGIPLFTLLVRAFLVRDATDMASVELLVLRAEESMAQEDLRKAAEEKAKVDAELTIRERAYELATNRVRAQEQLSRSDFREQQFLEQYHRALEGAVQAEAAVSTIAAAAQSRDFSELAATVQRATAASVEPSSSSGVLGFSSASSTESPLQAMNQVVASSTAPEAVPPATQLQSVPEGRGVDTSPVTQETVDSEQAQASVVFETSEVRQEATGGTGE